MAGRKASPCNRRKASQVRRHCPDQFGSVSDHDAIPWKALGHAKSEDFHAGGPARTRTPSELSGGGGYGDFQITCEFACRRPVVR